MGGPTIFTARVERHHDEMPRYVIVPAAVARELRITRRATVKGSVNGVGFERRSVLPWDERFFMNLPQDLCRRAGVDTGKSAEFVLEVMEDVLPDELARTLARAPLAVRERWEQLSASQKRQLANDVASAKRAETRVRRARRVLDRVAADPESG